MELTYNSIKKEPPNMHLHANKGPYNKSKLQHRSVVGFLGAQRRIRNPSEFQGLRVRNIGSKNPKQGHGFRPLW